MVPLVYHVRQQAKLRVNKEASKQTESANAKE